MGWEYVLTGQACISVERVYVEEPVYDEFVQKVVFRKPRPPCVSVWTSSATIPADVGSMATEQQRAIVSRHVEDAVSKGAKVLTGGKARDKGPVL